MGSISSAELHEVLVSGRSSEIIGAIETEHLDFKDQPYQTGTEKGKFSLLEDVTAFANHEGGTIVLGCRTGSTELEGDVVTEIRPILSDNLDFETYRSLLNTHVHPQVKGIKFFFYPTSASEKMGVAVIEVPKASEADRPHLIAHIVSEETGRKTTTKYALVVRTGARNSAYPVQTIHGLIKIGSAVGTLESSVQNIEKQLFELSAQARLSRSSDQISLAINRDAFKKLLPGFLATTGFATVPALVICALPSERIECRDIYDGASSIAKAFDNPPALREQGFDLAIRNAPEIVDGSARRKLTPGYKAVQLTISGRLIAVVRADEHFLAWGQQGRPGYPVEYRSYILAELFYIFAKYFKTIFESTPAPKEFDFIVALRNSFVDELAPVLGARRDHNPYGFSMNVPRPAEKPNMFKSIRLQSSLPTERLAFELRALLYHRFGYGDEAIPYTSITQEGRVTLPNEILEPNRQ